MQSSTPALEDSESCTDQLVNIERAQLTPSTHPVLPQEILDLIVSFVNDPQTLLACCLSSRTLLHMGTNMTLRSLYVKNETFQDILRELSNSPLKAFAVRHIITYCPYLGVNMNVPWDKVATLLTHLRNVDHFSLQSQSFQYHASPTVPFQGISSSHTVTRLTLTRTLFKNPVHVLGFINAFPNLQNLAMDIVLWSEPPSTGELNNINPPFRKPQLTALDVYRTGCPTGFSLAQFLLCDESVQRLETLGLEAPAEPDDISWWIHWKKDGVYEKLHHLTIYESDADRQDVLPSLPVTPNLKSLVLKGTFAQSLDEHEPFKPSFVLHFLHAVRTNSIEELFFEIDRININHIANIAFQEWAPYLSLDKFAKLSRVVYSFGDATLMNAKAEITAHILKAHEAWDKRDIVSVVFKADLR